MEPSINPTPEFPVLNPKAQELLQGEILTCRAKHGKEERIIVEGCGNTSGLFSRLFLFLGSWRQNTAAHYLCLSMTFPLLGTASDMTKVSTT